MNSKLRSVFLVIGILLSTQLTRYKKRIVLTLLLFAVFGIGTIQAQNFENVTVNSVVSGNNTGNALFRVSSPTIPSLAFIRAERLSGVQVGTFSQSGDNIRYRHGSGGTGIPNNLSRIRFSFLQSDGVTLIPDNDFRFVINDIDGPNNEALATDCGSNVRYVATEDVTNLSLDNIPPDLNAVGTQGESNGPASRVMYEFDNVSVVEFDNYANNGFLKDFDLNYNNFPIATPLYAVCVGDFDGDGIPDNVDVDDDNDGILDNVEAGGNDPNGDADGDGLPNFLDTSDDTGGSAAYTPDGSVTDYTDANSNGTPDVYENSDIDNDGIPNHLDLDSDGDGCSDALEGDGAVLISQVNASGEIIGGVDGNGVPNLVTGGQGDVSSLNPAITGDQCDDDGDGVINLNDVCPGFDDTVDNDLDGVPDGCDLDDDNDGILDTVEENCSTATKGFFDWDTDFGVTPSTTDISGSFPITSDLIDDQNLTVSFTDNPSNPGLDFINVSNAFGLGTVLQVANATGEPGGGITKFAFSNEVNNLTFSLQDIDARGSDFKDKVIVTAIRPDGSTIIISEATNIITKGSAASYEGNNVIIGIADVEGAAEQPNGTVTFKFFEPVTEISFQYFNDLASPNTRQRIGIADLDYEFVCDTDIDNDGIPNTFDTDSDGDGCSDSDEAYYGSLVNADSDNNGTYGAGTPTVDADGKVIGASYTAPDESYKDITKASCIDSDNDGIADFVDLDDDNDGILDTDEDNCSTSQIDWNHNDNNGQSDSAVFSVAGSAANYTSSSDLTVGSGLDESDNYAYTYLLRDATATNFADAKTGNDYVEVSFQPSASMFLTNVNLGFFTNSATVPEHKIGNFKIALEYSTSTDFSAANVLFENIQIANMPSGYLFIENPINNTLLQAGTTYYFRFYFYDEQNSDPENRVRFDDVFFTSNLQASCDIDLDGIYNSLDTDSDGDGCSDAIEGAGNITSSQLSTLTGGSVGGSSDNLGVTSDATGIPLVGGSAFTQASTAAVLDANDTSACSLDLSLTKTIDKPIQKVGQDVVFTITVTNDGPQTATNLNVKDILPTGLTYKQSISVIPTNTTYDATTGIWDISLLTLAPGDSITLKIGATIDTANVIQTNTAEIFSVTEQDIDSTPNNNN